MIIIIIIHYIYHTTCVFYRRKTVKPIYQGGYAYNFNVNNLP